MTARGLLDNWQLKALSLVLASVVWFYVVSADRAEISLPVPVEYVGLERGRVMIGGARDTVDVQVQAARWSSARVTPGTIRVRIDLARTTEGENTIHLSPAQVQVPAGVKVTRIAPPWLTVTVAAAATRAVRVVPQIRGTPAPDHALRRVVVEPPTVQVTGPRATIEARPTVETVPVDVSGTRQSITQTVGLVLPESVYPTNERTVQVTVEIQADESRRDRATGGERR